jgi:hypothetical protein
MTARNTSSVVSVWTNPNLKDNVNVVKICALYPNQTENSECKYGDIKTVLKHLPLVENSIRFNTFSNYYTAELANAESVPQRNDYACYPNGDIARIFMPYAMYPGTAAFIVSCEPPIDDAFSFVSILAANLNKDHQITISRVFKSKDWRIAVSQVNVTKVKDITSLLGSTITIKETSNTTDDWIARSQSLCIRGDVLDMHPIDVEDLKSRIEKFCGATANLRFYEGTSQENRRYGLFFLTVATAEAKNKLINTSIVTDTISQSNKKRTTQPTQRKIHKPKRLA